MITYSEKQFKGTWWRTLVRCQKFKKKKCSSPNYKREKKTPNNLIDFVWN